MCMPLILINTKSCYDSFESWGTTPLSILISKMFPKNSRRPLTLDHKIRLKKQLAKAYKSSGMEATSSDVTTKKRVHQNFKPRPEDKIIRKRQSEEETRDKIKEVQKWYICMSHHVVFVFCLFLYYYILYNFIYSLPIFWMSRKRINFSRNTRKNESKVSKSAVNRIKSWAPRTDVVSPIWITKLSIYWVN